jgi:hypothetical protein
MSAESFAPTIIMDGKGYQPKGHEWILGFALGGCQWAIDIAETQEFKDKVIAYLKEEKRQTYKDHINYLISEIEQYETKLNDI